MNPPSWFTDAVTKALARLALAGLYLTPTGTLPRTVEIWAEELWKVRAGLWRDQEESARLLMAVARDLSTNTTRGSRWPSLPEFIAAIPEPERDPAPDDRQLPAVADNSPPFTGDLLSAWRQRGG